jgi:exonuclease SbcC
LPGVQDQYEEAVALRENNENQIVQRYQTELNNLKKEQKSKQKMREQTISKIAKLEEKVKSLKEQKSEYNRIRKELTIFDALTQAVSKKGIPTQLINTMLPAINSEIAKILQGVVAFTVELEADLESNSMDIFINYGDSKRIIELASGMEKMISSLAIRVALINVSTMSKTNMLIIDEGFGALDETNLEACSRLLQSLKKWFRNILIISHVDMIKDTVDNTLDIMKKGKDSYVNNT